MKKIKLGKHTIELYDGIEELPITRFHAFNKMLLIDAGIGSDLQEFDNHIEKIIRYNRSKQPELVEVEIDNLRQNVYFVQNGISPRNLAFCALVKSVDGKIYDDITESGLKRVLELLNDITQADVTASLEAVKKKIDEELLLYYPKLFEDASVKEYFDNMKSRAMLMLDAIISGANKQSEIEEITTLLLTYAKPQKFTGSDSFEINYDKQFETMCLMISQYLHTNPKLYTVLEYYNAFEYIKSILKQKTQKAK